MCGVGWRSFQNKKEDGAYIEDDWRINGFPTFYLLDAEGAIAQSWVGREVGSYSTFKWEMQKAFWYSKTLVEEIVGAPADIISTGPDRIETIVRRHPFGS